MYSCASTCTAVPCTLHLKINTTFKICTKTTRELFINKPTKTFLLRSKHQLSNNASILAKSASITGDAGTGEPGDSSGERDDDDSRSTSGVLTTGVTLVVSTNT